MASKEYAAQWFDAGGRRMLEQRASGVDILQVTRGVLYAASAFDLSAAVRMEVIELAAAPQPIRAVDTPAAA